MKIDTKPYNLFKKLKEKYPAKMILITDQDLSMQGLHLAYKNHREYIANRFKQEGIEITRFSHNYNSLDTSHPQLGLVYLMNDSVIQPGVEVWALVEHNARYINGNN